MVERRDVSDAPAGVRMEATVWGAAIGSTQQQQRRRRQRQANCVVVRWWRKQPGQAERAGRRGDIIKNGRTENSSASWERRSPGQKVGGNAVLGAVERCVWRVGPRDATRPCIPTGMCEEMRQQHEPRLDSQSRTAHTMPTLHTNRPHASMYRTAAPWKVTLGHTSDSHQRRPCIPSRPSRPNFHSSRRAEDIPAGACRSIPARNLSHLPWVHLDQATTVGCARVVHIRVEHLCPRLAVVSTNSTSVNSSFCLCLSLLAIAPSISPASLKRWQHSVIASR
jgi:hypothetical protein